MKLGYCLHSFIIKTQGYIVAMPDISVYKFSIRICSSSTGIPVLFKHEFNNNGLDNLTIQQRPYMIH